MRRSSSGCWRASCSTTPSRSTRGGPTSPRRGPPALSHALQGPDAAPRRRRRPAQRVAGACPPRRLDAGRIRAARREDGPSAARESSRLGRSGSGERGAGDVARSVARHGLGAAVASFRSAAPCIASTVRSSGSRMARCSPRFRRSTAPPIRHASPPAAPCICATSCPRHVCRVATGRAALRSSLRVGDAVDRAVLLLESAPEADGILARCGDGGVDRRTFPDSGSRGQHLPARRTAESG